MQQALAASTRGSTVRFLPKEATVIFLVIWAQHLHGSGNPLVFALLTLWAMMGRQQAVQALSLSAIVVLLNPGLFPEQTYASMLKWCVVFVATGRIHLDAVAKGRRTPMSVLWLAVFTGIAGLSSLMVSYDFAVSAFKLGAFFLTSSAILVAFHGAPSLREYWPSWLLTLLLVVLASSAPLYFLSVGYFRNGVGFQGILNQPQAFGVFLAPPLALALSLWIGNGGRLGLAGLAAGGCFMGIVASGARTALVALGLAFAATMLIALLRRRDWLDSLSMLWRRWAALAVVVVAGAFLMLKIGEISEKAQVFLAKGDQSVNLEGGFQEARGQLIERSWANFLDHPILGIGFGVASERDDFKVERHPVLGIPVGTSIEKGFMPTAVLEENGILGGVAMLIVLFSLILPVVARGQMLHSWMLWTCLFINIGEMTFFSIGGLGLYVWLVMGFCTSCDPGTRRAPHSAGLRADRSPYAAVRSRPGISTRAA